MGKELIEGSGTPIVSDTLQRIAVLSGKLKRPVRGEKHSLYQRFTVLSRRGLSTLNPRVASHLPQISSLSPQRRDSTCTVPLPSGRQGHQGSVPRLEPRKPEYLI